MLGQVWMIGKRRFSEEWGRKIWMFDRLIWTVMGFGADIWGERERIDRIEKRYLRWDTGRTPGYLVREELQREGLRRRAGRRT